MNLRFEPWDCKISSTFWSCLAAKKLDEIGRGNEIIDIWGEYSPSSPVLSISEDCLSHGSTKSNLMKIKVFGKLYLLDTIEEYKEFDKQALMDSCNENSPFHMIVFADLKKHHFHHHILFPALFLTNAIIECQDSEVNNDLKDRIQKHLHENTVESFQISNKANEKLIVYVDSSSSSDPSINGWNLRNILWRERMNLDSIQVVSVGKESYRLLNSFKSTIVDEKIDCVVRCTGWNKSKVTDLSKLMDKNVLAKEASVLNLKLIKWRLLPSLSIPVIQDCKVMLVGMGTLGCNVARCLLGWGVENFIIIDNGLVSLSNPSRQSLYDLQDCGKSKVKCAKNRIKSINHAINVDDIEMNVPMPGHRVANKSDLSKDIKKLWALIKSVDVVYLLTDSRESRWLPALFAAIEQKICITSAMGFDSWMVMRHGDYINGLGCYFCSDPVSPSDSLSRRSLDQQCTVSRSGVSLQASSAAVEMLISLLQHPDGKSAPHTQTNSPIESLPDHSSCLGTVPHQVRGYLGHWQSILLQGDAFSGCVACSPKLINHVKNHSDPVAAISEMILNCKLVEFLSGASKYNKPFSDEAEDFIADSKIDEENGFCLL